jgi:hypothetical protein
LRGSKQFLYEGGIRVPFIVRGPGVAADSFCHEPVVAYDLWPTLRDLAGGGTDRPETVDGGSLRPVLEDCETGRVQRALPALVFHRPNHRSLRHSAIRNRTHKLVINWRNEQKELFNLNQDFQETNDISAEMPREAQTLFHTLTTYLKDVNAESPPPPPQYRVDRLNVVPKIDGRLNEWPMKDRKRSMVLQAGGGGPPSRAWLAYDDQALYIAVQNPVEDTEGLDQARDPQTQFDRVLLAIQDDFSEPGGPVLTLVGFPNGATRNVNYANAPIEALDRLFEGATYAANVGQRSWSCEWRIPFATLGFTPDTTPKVRFNLIVKKTRPAASCVWQSTGGYMWELKQAGLLVFTSASDHGDNPTPN